MGVPDHEPLLAASVSPTPTEPVMTGGAGFDGEAGGVLFRALEPISGIEQMAQARDLSMDEAADLRTLTSGPGRLAEAFGITRERDNEKDLTSPKSDLIIVDDGFRPDRIEVTPRIGITKATERPLRYIIAGNKFVSRG